MMMMKAKRAKKGKEEEEEEEAKERGNGSNALASCAWSVAGKNCPLSRRMAAWTVEFERLQKGYCQLRVIGVSCCSHSRGELGGGGPVTYKFVV